MQKKYFFCFSLLTHIRPVGLFDPIYGIIGVRHFLSRNGNGNGNGNGVTVTKQVDVIGSLVRILVP